MKFRKIEVSKNALLYLIAIIFFYLSSGAFSMLQGIYIKELKIGEDFLGFILSLRIFAVAIFSIPCAIFVNKYGRKKGIMVALLFVPISGALQGYFQDKWLLSIFAVIQGFSNAFLLVSEGPFLMENSNEKNRLKLFSYAFSDNVFSTMVGYYVFGHISNIFHNFFGIVNALRYSIIISGLIGVIGCVFIIFIEEAKAPVIGENNIFYKKAFSVIKQRHPRNFLVYNFIIGFGAGLVVPYFNVYLKYKVNATTDQIGLILALAMGAMGIGGLITPYMAIKFGKVKTIIICQVISIPFLMLIALPPSLIVVSFALFMRNALMNMAGPIVGNLSMEIIKEGERSIFASINNISGNLSRAVSAVVAGFIMKNFSNGYEIPYFITAILYLAATIYFYKSFSTLELKRKMA
ncbi:MFS transporter [Clostridium omnivorum]|nr:MFS transporter [Clostridium sp. E14]